MSVVKQCTATFHPTNTIGVFEVTLQGVTAQDFDRDRADAVLALDCRGDALIASYVRHDTYKRVSSEYPWEFKASYQIPLTELQEWQLRQAVGAEVARLMVLTRPAGGSGSGIGSGSGSK